MIPLPPNKILVTGASGFIGKHLTNKLSKNNYTVITVTRRSFPPISSTTNWFSILSKSIDTIIHLAARVHLMQDNATDPMAAYRETNTASTLNLAQQAADAGVRRFIFISSIKVNGEGLDIPYTEEMHPNPSDAYAVSKWEAEKGLLKIAQKTDMEIVILRPPLVYGDGVKANFLRMLQWINKGIPLPFGAIQNQRSLLYIGNLIDAIQICITHPSAANQTFLIGDSSPLSTSELIKKLAHYSHKPTRLFNIQPSVLRNTLALLGKKQEAKRLLSSLTLDNQHICNTLKWTPPFSTDEGLAQTVNALSSKDIK